MDSQLKWMQLFWLSRLAIRADVPEDEKNRYWQIMSDLGLLDKDKPENAGFDVHYGRFNPYQFGIGPLVSFYYGNIPMGDFERRVTEARSFAIRHFPYEVSRRDGIRLNGTTITRFASQLDFVVLKIATANPSELYAEAMGILTRIIN